jgi:hypothetical protein
VELKLLLKRGALLTAANWPTIAIQFAVQTTFQMLLTIPIIGAAILVAVVLGADLAHLLGGSTRDIFEAISRALASEPFALACFVTALATLLAGGSVLTFLVKGGTVAVFAAANEAAGPIELEPITYDTLRRAASFTLERFTSGCRRHFRRYLALGLALILVYGLSLTAYVAFVVVGYRAAGDRGLLVGWTFSAAAIGLVSVLWITLVNLLYLLMQVAIALEDLKLTTAARAVARFVRAEVRNLGGVFLVGLLMVVGAMLASALAWSGVGLVAFVPLFGLAVLPLQIVALVVRGLVLEFIGLTALGAYVTLYRRHAGGSVPASHHAAVGSSPGPIGALG